MPDQDRELHGAGLGLRRALLGPLLSMDHGSVDFMEAAPENWIGVGGRFSRQFRQLAERYPIVLHGLSLDVGGPDPIEFIGDLIDSLGGKPVRVEVRWRDGYSIHVVVKSGRQEKKVRFRIEPALAFAARHHVPLFLTPAVFTGHGGVQELHNNSYTSTIWPLTDLKPPGKKKEQAER